jgi:hypothetical protein
VPERNAHFAEVPLREFGQNISVDCIVTKGCLVLTEAKAGQPSPDVHLKLAPNQWAASMMSRTKVEVQNRNGKLAAQQRVMIEHL